MLHGRTHNDLTLLDLSQGIAILLDDRGGQCPAGKLWQLEEVAGVGVICFGYLQIRLAQCTIDDGTFERRIALANDVLQGKIFLRHRRVCLEIHLMCQGDLVLAVGRFEVDQRCRTLDLVENLG